MAGHNLRFGVGSKTNSVRAASWKIWSPPKKNDIYIATRELRGALKVSLHQSSKWHFAYDPAFFENKISEDKRTDSGRFIDRWPPLRPIASGITVALRIVTPWTALKPGEPEDKIELVDPPDEVLS